MRRRRAALLGLYVALLAALTLLLWLALVTWFPTPPPAAIERDRPQAQRPTAPLMAPGALWWQDDAVGIVGAYAAGGVGMLVGAVVTMWREHDRERKPSAA